MSLRVLAKRAVPVVVAVGLVAGCGAAVAANRSNDARTEHCALLPDAIGLYQGNEVTRMGLKIGIITAITPSPESVRVDFTLERNEPVLVSTRVVTRAKSILADRSLELVPARAPGGAQLTPGQCISLTNAYTPKSISEIAGSAADLLEQLAPLESSPTLETAVTAMANELVGVGSSAGRVLRTAASAARSPDQAIADLRSIIVTMAPLTDTALANWRSVESIVTKLPEATTVAADKLWPGAADMVEGLVPLIDALFDVQTRYGQYIWPASDYVAVGLHIAAGRVGDIQRSLKALPSLASAAALVSQRGRGAVLQVGLPKVKVPVDDSTLTCARLTALRANSCRVAGPRAVLIPADALVALGSEIR